MKILLKLSVFIFILSVLACGCKKDSVGKKSHPNLNPKLKYGTVKDIDGNSYATIEIGGKTWMAEDLRTNTLNNGAGILEIKVISDWDYYNDKVGYSLWCYYNFDEKGNYGKIYNWTAVKSGKLCPKGWHIPSKMEWKHLLASVGSSDAIAQLTAQKWAPDGQLYNTSGFSAVPGGYLLSGPYAFGGRGSYSYWWSSTIEGSVVWIFFMELYEKPEPVVGLETITNSQSYYCRCVQDD